MFSHPEPPRIFRESSAQNVSVYLLKDKFKQSCNHYMHGRKTTSPGSVLCNATAALQHLARPRLRLRPTSHFWYSEGFFFFWISYTRQTRPYTRGVSKPSKMPRLLSLPKIAGQTGVDGILCRSDRHGGVQKDNHIDELATWPPVGVASLTPCGQLWCSTNIRPTSDVFEGFPTGRAYLQRLPPIGGLAPDTFS